MQFAFSWSIIIQKEWKGGKIMSDILKEYFASSKIEYYAALSYGDCIVSSERIIAREDFKPKSVIIYLLPYYAGECENLSVYAASYDYHIILKEIGEGLIRALAEKYPNAKMKSYGDHSPIDERAAALSSGLGIAGDNGLLINEKYGSYIFIGDVITDIPPEELSAIKPREIRRCDGCGACRSACPTGALRGESYDCLSAITQKKGELSPSEVELMKKHNTVWGCDICQSVCPYNAHPVPTPIEFFYRDRIPHLTREILDGLTNDEFERRAFAWRKRKTVERNLELLYGENANNDN